MANYKITGLNKLQSGLIERTKETAVKSVVKKHTTQMQQRAMSTASSVYVKGYSTGATKKSIGIGFENGGLSGITGLGTSYAQYVEYGTRFMAAEPLLKPVFNRQKTLFKSDLEKLLK